MVNIRKGSRKQIVHVKCGDRKWGMGRNGREEYDESSEANLINRRVKIAIQSPRGVTKRMTEEQRGSRKWVAYKGREEKKSGTLGDMGVKHLHVRQTDCRRCS